MLDWSRFKSLSGADTDNFEKLCRSIVRRQFGFLGPLKELKNQPGVEYHIKLSENDTRLGSAGQIVGWQCKWFQYRANGHLTASAKTQIEHSLKTTYKHLPNLTHWILWTHKTLAKGDQDWFYGLESNYGFKLHLWNEGDLDEQLSGVAIDLRHSYFGELALTSKMLADQHEKSVAPINNRWLHVVHQVLDIEHQSRKILGEPHAWEGFEKTRQSLNEAIRTIGAMIEESVYHPFASELNKFISLCEMYADYCSLFQNPICGEHIARIKDLAEATTSDSQNSIQNLLRLLRRKNLPLSLVITNALAYIKDTKALLKDAQKLLTQQLVAVVADAGGGKTQFAAELTSPSPERPAGVLLLGRDLKSGQTLDALSQRISFYTQQVNNFEALISAIDAAGTRAGCRLPIVIDGLNEAEDPRDWKPILESIQPMLNGCTNVVLICTLRTGKHNRSRPQPTNTNSREGFAQQALPENCLIMRSEGFSDKITYQAIKVYFDHYKIEADQYMAPIDFFSHPLNLKIFCEVTNRNGKNIVRVDHFRSSIYSLFGEQVKHSANTIAGMTNLAVRYRASDIDNAIYILGETLWKEGNRSASEKQFRLAYNIESQEWESDIVNLLVQEGFMFRDEVTRLNYKLTPVYDRFGGYFIAYYLIEKNKASEHVDWMEDDEILQKLFGEIPHQHELSQDILHALVALTPKYFKGQVWQVIPPEYSALVLCLSHLIERNDICEETIKAYKQYIIEKHLPRNVIVQLRALKKAVHHPFNADFLNDVLTELSVTDRDLSWTEYNRDFFRGDFSNFNKLIDYWKSGNWNNNEVERLGAVSISWLLTSTCLHLRDLATEALFNYGLHQPGELLKITSGSLTVNDPYVLERLLAASYGVIGTLIPKDKAIEIITQFALELHSAMFVEDAKTATTHLLTREYASLIIRIVNKCVPGIFSAEHVKSASPPFPSMPRKVWEKESAEKKKSISESPFRMDFENYTIGRLVKGRANYDYKHPEYKSIKNKILWRIKDLGWSSEKFSDTEKIIESYGGYSRGNRPKVERYGKKYSWIAYYEMAGLLDDKEVLKHWEERFCADIDPFFPKNSKPAVKESTMFLKDTTVTTKEWIIDSDLPDLADILTTNEVGEHPDHWVLLHGYISEDSKRLDRNFYCSIRMFLFEPSSNIALQGYIKNSNPIDWPDVPEYHYIYSGELYCNNKSSINENIQITVGHKEQEFELPRVVINGKCVEKGGKRISKVPIYESISVQIPSIRYCWESSDSLQSGISRVLLAPWVVETLGLSFNATNLSYTDSKGLLAAVYIYQQGEGYDNCHEFFYLRKDLVEKLSASNGFKLVSKIRGERRLSRTEHFDSNDNSLVRYKTFDFITPFSP